MRDLTELGFQGQNIHGNQGLIQGVLTRKGSSVLWGSNNFMEVSLKLPFGWEPAQSVIKTRGEGTASLNFQIDF